MLRNSFLLHTKYKHTTLAIRMLNNIFLLHTKTQDYHRKYPNVLNNYIIIM